MHQRCLQWRFLSTCFAGHNLVTERLWNPVFLFILLLMGGFVTLWNLQPACDLGLLVDATSESHWTDFLGVGNQKHTPC